MDTNFCNLEEFIEVLTLMELKNSLDMLQNMWQVQR